MYSGYSGGGSNENASQRKIPPASSMLWVRNLRRFIGSGAALGSEAPMELETKRILLYLFKEKQPKSAEAGAIPSFYRKKPEEGSISHMVQRLAKYRFLKKQSDLLLSADDLDAMWVCLRENCVIDDATGAEKESEEEVTDTELAENWFSLTSARQICDMFLALDKDMNGTLSKQELQEYADGALTLIFIERVPWKKWGGNSRRWILKVFSTLFWHWKTKILQKV